MNERVLKFAFSISLLSLVFLPMGCKKPPPITLACNASAPAIYPGEPLTVTATVGSDEQEIVGGSKGLTV